MKSEAGPMIGDPKPTQKDSKMDTNRHQKDPKKPQNDSKYDE